MFGSDVNSQTCPEQIQKWVSSRNIVRFERSDKLTKQLAQFSVIMHQASVSFSAHLTSLPVSLSLRSRPIEEREYYSPGEYADGDLSLIPRGHYRACDN